MADRKLTNGTQSLSNINRDKEGKQGVISLVCKRKTAQSGGSG